MRVEFLTTRGLILYSVHLHYFYWLLLSLKITCCTINLLSYDWLILSSLTGWYPTIVKKEEYYIHLHVTQEVNKAFYFLYNGLKLDRPLKYCVSKFVWLLLHTNIFAWQHSIWHLCINSKLNNRIKQFLLFLRSVRS